VRETVFTNPAPPLLILFYTLVLFAQSRRMKRHPIYTNAMSNWAREHGSVTVADKEVPGMTLNKWSENSQENPWPVSSRWENECPKQQRLLESHFPCPKNVYLVSILPSYSTTKTRPSPNTFCSTWSTSAVSTAPLCANTVSAWRPTNFPPIRDRNWRIVLPFHGL